jgi:isopentenyldiphosphate isomerase
LVEIMNNSLVQIVDNDDNVVGAAPIDEVHYKGLWHRIVRVMVEDERHNILLQMRGPNVDTSPNMWDHSAAGHVDEGETYEQAALRELAEETGIRAKHIREIGTFKSNNTYDNRILNRINKVYRLVIASATPLYPEMGEVTELKWISKNNLSQLIADHPDQVTEGLKYVFTHYFSDGNMNS